MPSEPTLDAAFLFEEFILPGALLLGVAAVVALLFAKHIGYREHDD